MVRSLILLGLFGPMTSIAAFAEELADPTQPPARATEPGKIVKAHPAVSALILRKDKSSAIIGTRVVRVGDRLEGGRILRIDERGIWVTGPAGLHCYTLLSEDSQHSRSQGRSPNGTERAQTR